MQELEKSLSLEKIFEDGDKVKLNYEQIVSHPDFMSNKKSKEKHIVEYHKFIENNKNNILTIELIDGYKTFITFKEDEKDKNTKWIFSMIDLIKID